MNQMNTPKTPLMLVKRLVQVLEHYEPHIRKALTYGGDAQTFEQVCNDVLAGQMFVHTLPNAVLLCEKVAYAKGHAYSVTIAAGDLDEILDFQRDDLIRAAKAHGCSALSFSGRLGWQKALQSEGWKPLNITMAKEI